MNKVLGVLFISMNICACGKSTDTQFTKTEKSQTEPKAKAFAKCGTRELSEFRYRGEKAGLQYELTIIGNQFRLAHIIKTCDQSGCVRGGPVVRGEVQIIPAGTLLPNLGILSDLPDQDPLYYCEVYDEIVALKKTEIQRAMTDEEYKSICN